MINNLTKKLYFKKAALIALAVFILFIFSGNISRALGLPFVDVDFTSVFLWPFNMVRSGIAALVMIMGRALDWSISGITSFADENFVKMGARISRDMANMFLTLILIVISLATIFRYQEYGAKKLLPKLITVALLINFSLVIAGGLIDASNVFSKFFLDMAAPKDPGTGKNISISEQLVNGMGIAGMSVVNDAAVQSSDETPPAKTFKGIMMQIVFLSMTVFVLGAGFFFMLVRTIYLWILLVLSPLAFMAYILPSTREHWHKWWNNFIKWVLFAPVFTFFLALAILNIQSVGSLGAGQSFFQNEGLTGMGFDMFSNSLRSIMQFFMFGALTIGGLMVAQTMGVVGANTAREWAMSGYKKAAKGAARITGAEAIGRRARGYAEGAKEGALQRLRQTSIKGFKPFKSPEERERIRQAKEQMEKETARRRFGVGISKEDIDKSNELIKESSESDIMKTIENSSKFDKMPDSQKIAYIKKAAKEGWIKDRNHFARAQNALDALKKSGIDERTLKNIKDDITSGVKKGGRADLSVLLDKGKNLSERADIDVRKSIVEEVVKMDLDTLNKQKDEVLNEYLGEAVQEMNEKKLARLAAQGSQKVGTVASAALKEIAEESAPKIIDPTTGKPFKSS